MVVQKNATTKKVLVGAPGENLVYVFNVTGHSISAPTQDTISSGFTGEFGHSMSATPDASMVAIGSPGYDNGAGRVDVFAYNTLTSQYVLFAGINIDSVNTSLNYKVGTSYVKGYLRDNGHFGDTVTLSDDGEYLFVSAPDTTYDSKKGAVIVC